jgi:hypothetical protein
MLLKKRAQERGEQIEESTQERGELMEENAHPSLGLTLGLTTT